MDSWITEYNKIVDPVSESPVQFNVWAAISLIGSVLKKNVFINYRTFTIYPNQYIVLVAPPGIGKGEAIHPAHGLAKDKLLVNYMSDRITAPRIVEKLFHGFSGTPTITNGQVIAGNKDQTATLISTELPTLLTSSDWMLQFMCDAWDKGEFDYDTRNKGSFTVNNMCVSLIGACVPDYIRKINKDANATVSSGFSARTIFVNSTLKSKHLPWGISAKTDPAHIAKMEALAQDLIKIGNLKGEFILDPFAIQVWNKYREELEATISEDDTDVYKNFKSRQPIHVLKTAMVVAASFQPTDLIITKAILDKAIYLVGTIAEGVDDIFRGVGESDLSSAIARLQLYLERKGTVTYNQILADNMRFLNPEDVQRTLKVLCSIGFATEAVVGNNIFTYSHTGRPINPNAGKHKMKAFSGVI